MNTDQIMALCDQVRETAYAVHKYHGNGYPEKVYENALAHRLRKAGLKFAKSDRTPTSSTIKQALSLFALFVFFRG